MTRPVLDREALLDDPTIAGRDFCAAYTAAVDDWLRALFADAVPDAKGLALVAVGGYGRAELAPGSDLDLLLLHAPRRPPGGAAQALWYPIWDAGLKLGHAVRTVKQALALGAEDLDTATSLLTCRHLAGERALSDDLAEHALALWRKRSKRWLAQVAASVHERHRQHGEVAFLLEPDLKEGRGGLRDVHALGWSEAARPQLTRGDPEALAAAGDTLLAVRVELHRRTRRPSDRLVLQEQDAVAEALGYEGADALMADVSRAARTVAWIADEAWGRTESALAGPTGRLARSDRQLGPGVILRDGEVHLEADADPALVPALVLRVGVAAAQNDARIDRSSLDRLAAEVPPFGDPWPDGARGLLADLLLAGRPAIRVLETLDQRGLLVRILPEWEPVRSRPQRNAYHQFTVDRHLWEAAVNAAALADSVHRHDLLVIGALLHDIGKGYPGDHTDVGIDLVERIGPRMGFPPEDVAVLADMVRHHLLLPDVATRRDLRDDDTIAAVAEAAGSLATLEVLAALTEADSLATGPAAWGAWKAGLVSELVARTAERLGGPAHQEASGPLLTDELRARMAYGSTYIRTEGRTLTVISRDRPGTFSQVAGALAVSGLDVLESTAHSERASALSRFTVSPSHGDTVDWEKVTDLVRQALVGELALDAKVAEREQAYARTGAVPEADAAPPEVRVDNAASGTSTVIEVYAPDAIGILYRLTKAFAGLGLDIRTAKVQTLGNRVVDSFYVRTASGDKVTDPDRLAEVERAILAALG
ncbi:MAG: [protein-PII] uridylyltransferase [Acidimicrobiales bacterium]